MYHSFSITNYQNDTPDYTKITVSTSNWQSSRQDFTSDVAWVHHNPYSSTLFHRQKMNVNIQHKFHALHNSLIMVKNMLDLITESLLSREAKTSTLPSFNFKAMVMYAILIIWPSLYTLKCKRLYLAYEFANFYYHYFQDAIRNF